MSTHALRPGFAHPPRPADLHPARQPRRAGAPGLRAAPRLLSTSCSAYLLSAFLVLLGGYLRLHDAGGRPTTNDMVEVYGTHLAYEAALLLAVAFLFRVRREVRDTVVLLAVLGVFLLDGLLVQDVYGWERGPGMLAAAIGCLSAVAMLVGVALALRLPLVNRLFGTVLAAVLFTRLAPAVLVAGAGDGPQVVGGIAVRYVALGWILAAAALAVFLPTLARVPSSLPLAAIERGGLVGCLVLAVVHLVAAGQGFGLPFSVVYLAPLVILLAPAIEHAAPDALRVRAVRVLVGCTPWVGLLLAAARFPPGMGTSEWARTWPLTPFTLALALAAAVQLARGVGKGSATLRHAAAAIAMLLLLGGDLPEILTRAVYPAAWQVVAVNVLAWSAIVAGRDLRYGSLLQAASGFVFASYLADHDYPWGAACAVVLGAGILATEAVTGWILPPVLRLGVAGVVLLVPVAVLFTAPRDRLVLTLLAAVLAAALALGWLRRDRLLRQLVPLAALTACLAWLLAVQGAGPQPAGRLVTEAGFAVLAAAVVGSVRGRRLADGWRAWWDEASELARDPSAAELAAGSGVQS